MGSGDERMRRKIVYVDMDGEAAMAAARSYLADCIELTAISEEEVERLQLYWFSNHRNDYHFFYYRSSWEVCMVGSSSWIAVSKKSGRISGTGKVGE
jgi:hypothetical protein